MLCKNCHREIDEYATECTYCGADIKPDYNTLITEVLNNNIKANEVLYNTTYKQVYFIASKLSNVMQSPDDIVSRCYETALDNLHVLSNRNNFQRWINSICATIIVSGIRKQRPDFLREKGGPAILPEHPAGDYKPVMNKLASNPNISQASANFIYKLTDEEKLFYLMYYYNGMSAAEISKIFKISPSSVTMHISSLNQKIRDELIAFPTADNSPLACTAFAKLGLANQFEEAFPTRQPIKIPQENIPLADDVRRMSSYHDRTQIMDSFSQNNQFHQQPRRPQNNQFGQYPNRPQNHGYDTNGRNDYRDEQYGANEQPMHRRRPPRPQPEENHSQDTGSKLRMALILSACSVIIIAAIIITLVLFKKENYDDPRSDFDAYNSYEEIEPIMPTTEPPTEPVTESPDRERPEFDYDRQSQDAEQLLGYVEDFMFADDEEKIVCYYILDIDFDGGMEFITREITGDNSYRHEIYDITSDGDVTLSNTLKSSDKSYYVLREIVREDKKGSDYEFVKYGKTGKVYSYSLETEETTLLEEYDEDYFFCGPDESNPRTVYILYSDGSEDPEGGIEIEVPTEPETEPETEEETEASENDSESSENDNENSASGKTGTVKVDDTLKLRSSPSTSDSSNIVAKMPNKSKVTLISEDKITENGMTWYKVKYTDTNGNTHEGYAACDYITID